MKLALLLEPSQSVAVTFTSTNKPLALQAFRPAKGGSWTLRLTTKQPFLSESSKVIHLSSTAVPERLRLLYGGPTKAAKWIVYMAKLAKKELRVAIADKSYSQSCILPKKAEPLRARLFETVDKLIEVERERTGLPVAVFGISAIVNVFLEHRLGKQAHEFRMPFKAAERADKTAALEAITMPLGFMVGYAYAVAGSNDFCIDDHGTNRFVRSLIVLGNIIPPLEGVARDHRGLFADVRNAAVDWTPTRRTVAFKGTESDGKVMVARNVTGYRDDVANAVLFGIYKGELLQITGRMRGQLADPVDPTIEPAVHMFCGVAIPRWTRS